MFGEAEKIAFANDCVILDFNSEKLPGIYQLLGNIRILLGRRWVASRMIVRDDNLRRQMPNSRLKYFSGMDEISIERPNRNDFPFDFLISGIQKENHEMLFFMITNILEFIPDILRGQKQN